MGVPSRSMPLAMAASTCIGPGWWERRLRHGSSLSNCSYRSYQNGGDGPGVIGSRLFFRLQRMVPQHRFFDFQHHPCFAGQQMAANGISPPPPVAGSKIASINFVGCFLDKYPAPWGCASGSESAAGPWHRITNPAGKPTDDCRRLSAIKR